MATLPELCLSMGASLDVVRGLIRKTRSLREMGRKFGPTRVFDEREQEAIRAAFKSRANGKTKKLATV